MKKKIIISVLAVLIVVSSCVGVAISSKSNDNSSTNKANLSAKSSTTATVHTDDTTTVSPTKTTTKTDETTKKLETTKSTTQKSASSKKQSSSSGSSKSNGNSQKRTTKKSTTTTKKETTTKAKSYAMSASEIRNYALNEIAKIDGTIYESEMSKENAGWNTPLVVYPGDSESTIKEGIKGKIWWYNGTTKNGYNVYIENTTDYSGDKCMKVYFLYGQVYTGPPEI